MQMDMSREKAQGYINSLVDVHIEALRGDAHAPKIAEALENARSDFHALIDIIYDEIEMITSRDSGFDRHVDEALENAQNRDDGR